MKGQNESFLILSDLKEKLDVPALDEPAQSPPPSHRTIVVSAQPPQQPDASQEQLTSSLDWKQRCQLLVVVLALAVVLAGLGVYFLLAGRYENEVVSKLVAQPFTENNDFVYFHLSNGMRVLFIRPNTYLNDTYICEIKSIVCWSWLRDRP